MTNNLAIGEVVRIECDDNQYAFGTLVGTANRIITDRDSYYGRESGEIITYYLIHIDPEFRGTVHNDDGPTLAGHIELVVAYPDNVSRAPIYVNVYDYGRAYGGPEEGGWWYDTYEPVSGESYVFDNLNDAKQKQAELMEIWCSEDSSITDPNGEYRVLIQYREPHVMPKFRPTYS